MNSLDVLSNVRDHISRNNLIESGHTVVIGVSGGPDSVALLDLMMRLQVELDLEIHIAHVNHGLRGEESDKDQEFVAHLAHTNHLPFHCEAIQLESQGKSLEEAARDARHAFLEAVRGRTGSDRIALGHTRSDQAETFLLRLFRGAGTKGLGAIRPLRDGVWIRPLLALPRQQILAYNKFRNMACRTDESNFDTRFLRNRVRHQLIPEIAENYNPAIEEVLARSAEILQQEDELLEQLTDSALPEAIRYKGKQKIILDVNTLFRYHISIQRRILRKVLLWLQFSATDITFKTLHRVLDLLHKPSGKVQISPGFCLQKFVGSLILSRDTPPFETTLAVPGTTPIPWLEASVEVSVRPVSDVVDDLDCLGEYRACFDLSELGSELVIRNPRQGDRFQPFGMSGTQKISRLLINAKTPRTLRDQVPLLLNNSSILWAVGLRRAQPFSVTSKTKEVLDVVFEGGCLSSASL